MGWPYQQKPPMGWPLDYDSGLVPEAGCWLLNEGSGNTVQDLSGKGNIGTLVAQAHWGVGKFGPAVFLDGTGDWIDLGINAYDLGIRRNATFCVWAKHTDITPSGTDAYIGDYNNSQGMNLRLNTNGTVDFFVYPDNYRATTTATVHEGYNFICGVMTGSTVEVYFDGVLKASAALGGDVGDSAGNLKFGARGDESDPLNGEISHGYIYSHALSPSEIALLYREPFCMFKDPSEIALLGGYQGAPPGTILPQIIAAYTKVSA